MKVTTPVTPTSYSSVERSTSQKTGQSSFEQVLQETGKSTGAQQTSQSQKPDFSSMTRQQLRDWMSDQLQSGKMSLDDSSVFLGLTMHIPVDGNQMQDQSFATEKVNFSSLVQQGLEGARSRNDTKDAELLTRALTIMEAAQGHSGGFQSKA